MNDLTTPHHNAYWRHYFIDRSNRNIAKWITNGQVFA